MIKELMLSEDTSPTHAEECVNVSQTCTGCGEHSCDYLNYSSQNDADYCDTCRETDSEYMSTLVYFSNQNDAPVKFYLGDYFSFDEYGDDLPSNIKRNYIKTDGWRGYYQTEIENTVEIESGADLWGQVTDVRELAERISEAHSEGILPCDVYVAVDLTSNVFATAMSILVNKSDVETFKEWSQN